MFEAGIAAGLLVYLVLLGALGIESQFWAGSVATSVGLIGGGSAGVVYHRRLRDALVRLGADQRGWLWSPVTRHRALDERGRRQVLPWFRLGAAGFLLCMAGIGMVAVAALRIAFAG